MRCHDADWVALLAVHLLSHRSACQRLVAAAFEFELANFSTSLPAPLNTNS